MVVIRNRIALCLTCKTHHGQIQLKLEEQPVKAPEALSFSPTFHFSATRIEDALSQTEHIND